MASTSSASRTKASDSALGQTGTFAKAKEENLSKTSGTLSATSSILVRKRIILPAGRNAG